VLQLPDVAQLVRHEVLGDVLQRRAHEDGDLVIRLHVAPEDIGRVIGRGGRIARALRTVVRACGAREDRRVLLEIDD